MKLPIHWQEKKIGELCNLQSGGTPSRTRADFYGGRVPWAKISDLETSADGFVTETEEYITSAGLESINNRIFEKGTLLLAIYGSVGKVAFSGVSLSTNQAILGIQPVVKDELDLRFLKYWFVSQKENLLHGARGVALKNLSASIIKSMSIPFPSFKEQQKIAAILDVADSLRQKDQQLVERYTALSQSLFLEMFGDPLTNPRKWEFSSLSSLVTAVIDCPHTTPRWTQAGKVAIRTSNLTAGGWAWDDKRYVSEHEFHERSARAYVKSGDIVLSREGTVGVAAIVSKDMEICLGQRLVQIQPNLKVANNQFLLNLILYELAPERIERVMVGATSKHLNLKDLRVMKMISPPISLQNQFAEGIEHIQAQKEQAQRSLEKSEALFNSLLERAFTGELTAKMAA